MIPLPHKSPSRRGGFSVVELLVVVFVIMVLVGITVSVVNKARRSGNAARLKSDMIAISMAIDQFKVDHKGLPGMVPHVPPGVLPPNPSQAVTNANLLATNALAYSLVSPEPASMDGLEGPGFRVGDSRTKSWPAYLDAGKFRAIHNPTLADGTQLKRGWEILDAFETPILYLPRRKPAARADVGLLTRFPAGSFGAYDAADVDGVLNVLPAGDGRKGLLMALGDRNLNGKIDGNETATFSGDYILISAGVDREFFTGQTHAEFQKSDDVYNFDR